MRALVIMYKNSNSRVKKFCWPFYCIATDLQKNLALNVFFFFFFKKRHLGWLLTQIFYTALFVSRTRATMSPIRDDNCSSHIWLVEDSADRS